MGWGAPAAPWRRGRAPGPRDDSEQLVTARARTCPPVRCQRPAESAPPFNLPASSVLPGDGNYMELEGRLSVSESARHSAPYRHRPQESTLGPSELNPVRTFTRQLALRHIGKSLSEMWRTPPSPARAVSPSLPPSSQRIFLLSTSHPRTPLAHLLPPSLPPSLPPRPGYRPPSFPRPPAFLSSAPLAMVLPDMPET